MVLPMRRNRNFFNADDDPDYSPAPPLCVDAIRMVSPFHIRDLVVDRIFPEWKSMVDALGGLDRDAAKLLLASYIGFLVQKAPEEEQNFPMLLELLNASKVYDDPDSKNAVDLMMEEDVRDRNPLPNTMPITRNTGSSASIRSALSTPAALSSPASSGSCTAIIMICTLREC